MKNYFNRAEIVRALSEYSKQVKENGFEKIPYSIWRKLSSAFYWDLSFYKDKIVLKHLHGVEAFELNAYNKNFGHWLSTKYGNYVTYREVDINSVKADKGCYGENDYSICTKHNINTTNYKDEGEDENMNTNNIFNCDFGRCDSSVRLSMYGLAVKGQNGKWVSYDKSTDSMIDVDVFNFEANQFMFKMPVAIKDIAAGDVVIHMRKPMFVVEITGFDLEVVDIYSGEQKIIKPVKNMFGFNYYTKIVNLFDTFGTNAEANENNPFGNMWMLAAMGDSMDTSMLAMMMLAGGQTANPMMMALLMSKDIDDKNNLLPLLMMNQMNNNTKTE